MFGYTVKIKKIYFLPLLALLLLAYGCRRDEDFSSWDTEVLTPIASTSLTIDNIIKGSQISTNPDSSLQLVYEYPIYTAYANDFFTVPDTEIKATLTLERLQLADRTLTQSITLGQVYPAAILLNGQSIAVPAQNINSIPPTPIDASSFFETAVLKEGFMDITIANGFPIDIEEVEFELVNTVTNTVLVSDKMNNITAGTSKTVTADLADKKVDADLEVRITRLKTYSSSGPVLINSNDKVDITITVRGLKPKSATAIFPEQSVYSKDENALYDFDGAQIKKLKIKSGILRLRIVSTIEEAMTVNYSIPHATRNGNSVNEILNVKAAPKGGNTDVIRDIPLNGYTIDLRGKNPLVDDTVNAFWNILDVRLDSSGIQRSISLNDSVYIYYGLLDMIPEWAEGYFAQQELKAGPSIENFDFFSNNTGSISFDDFNAELTLTNGIGAIADIDIKDFSSKNTRSGNTIKLNATPLNSIITMPAATDNPFTEKITTYALDKSNSNITPFINNLPDQLGYEMTITTSPNGNVNNWKDFIYDKSKVEAKLKLSTPLAFTANNLSLSDTLPFEIFSTGNLNRVKEGTFNIIVDNSFPLSAFVQLYIIDAAGAITDSVMLQQNNLIQAAPIDANTGKVTVPSRSVLKAYFNAERMEKVKNAKRLLMKATFNTPTGITKPINIYSNYKFDIKLTGDFVYEQRF